MATDIAIVMGVVALLGSRAPSWLKLFLLALAIVDDIGAILVIAIFYSEGVSFEWLAIAIGAVAVAASIRNSVPWIGVYVALGAICWLGLHEANVHPTLAGVAFGMLAPVTPPPDSGMIDADQLAARARRRATPLPGLAAGQVDRVDRRVARAPAAPVVGVHRRADLRPRQRRHPGSGRPSSVTHCQQPVTWGVMLGLVVGKTVGITGGDAARRGAQGRHACPVGVTPRYVIGAGALGGIGFTVSLFVTELAFGEEVVGTDARLGVLIASFVGGADRHRRS